MANPENLKLGGEAHTLSVEEASKGGKKSAEVRRAKRDLKRAFDALLEKDFKGKSGDMISGAEAIAIKQFEKALQGDPKAFELVRDTAGQKPVERFMVAEVDQSVIDEVEQMVLGEDYDGQQTD